MTVAAPALISSTVPVQPIAVNPEVEKDLEAAERIKEFVCPVTGEAMKEVWALICGHSFEKSALDNIVARAAAKSVDPICSVCRREFKPFQMVKNYAMSGTAEKVGHEFRRLEVMIEANRVQSELKLKTEIEAVEAKRQADLRAAEERSRLSEARFAAMEARLSSTASAQEVTSLRQDSAQEVASLRQEIETIKRLAEDRRVQEEKNRKDSALCGLAYLGVGEAMGLVIFGAAGIACPPALPACLGIGAAIGGGAGVVIGLEEAAKKYATRRDEINIQFAELRVQNASQN